MRDGVDRGAPVTTAGPVREAVARLSQSLARVALRVCDLCVAGQHTRTPALNVDRLKRKERGPGGGARVAARLERGDDANEHKGWPLARG